VHTEGERERGLEGCKSPQIEIKKKKSGFVDTISNILHDLPSNQNQALKSAD
jgi:hypothetical protein